MSITAAARPIPVKPPNEASVAVPNNPQKRKEPTAAAQKASKHLNSIIAFTSFHLFCETNMVSMQWAAHYRRRRNDSPPGKTPPLIETIGKDPSFERNKFIFLKSCA
jgi:hypothetical protein